MSELPGVIWQCESCSDLLGQLICLHLH